MAQKVNLEELQNEIILLKQEQEKNLMLSER